MTLSVYSIHPLSLLFREDKQEEVPPLDQNHNIATALCQSVRKKKKEGSKAETSSVNKKYHQGETHQGVNAKMLTLPQNK